jgi:selenocysteine lyase/cysteine desulfurase
MMGFVVRPSFAFYITREDADALVETLRRIGLKR